MAYIDKDKIPYYLDTSEGAPMEGRKIAFKSDIDKISPADVVEVVRCKDCKHCEDYDEPDEYGWYHCAMHDMPTKLENFCNFGERSDTK